MLNRGRGEGGAIPVQLVSRWCAPNLTSATWVGLGWSKAEDVLKLEKVVSTCLSSLNF